MRKSIVLYAALSLSVACTATPTPPPTPTPIAPTVVAPIPSARPEFTPTPQPSATPTFSLVNDSANLSQRLAFLANDVRAEQPAHSFLLSVEAWQAGESQEARRALLENIRHQPAWLSGLGINVESGILSADGALAFLGEANGTVSVWNITTPQRPALLARFLVQTEQAIEMLAVRPDDAVLVTGSAADEVQLWDVREPTQPQPLSEAFTFAGLNALAFRPDGQRLLLGNDEGQLQVWDVMEPAAPQPLGEPVEAQLAFVESISFRADGKILATAGGPDDSVRVWELSDDGQLALLSEPALSEQSLLWVNNVRFSPDGNVLAASRAHFLTLWDVRNPRAPRPLAEWPLDAAEPQATVLYDFDFAPDGQSILSTWSNAELVLVDVSEPRQPQAAQKWLHPEGGAARVLFHAAQPLALTLPVEGAATLWNTAPTSELALWSKRLVENYVGTNLMAYSADGSLLAMEYYSDVIKGLVLWDMREPMQPRAASEPFGTLTFPQSVAFSPSRQVMAVGNYEDAVQLWDVSDTDYFEPWSDLPTDQAFNVWSMAFSPDNALLVTGSYDAKVLVWDVLDPTAPQLLAGPLSGYSDGVARMQFLPNSRVLATLSWDDTLHFWDLTQPRQPQRLGERLGNRIASFAVRADGLVLITGHETGDVRFWDVRNPAAPQPLGEAWRVADEAVRLLALSADDRVLAVGLESSGQLQLWEVSNPAQMIELGEPLQLDSLRGLTSHPAYGQLAAWQLEEAPVLLDLDVESWQTMVCQRAGRNLTQTEWRQYLGQTPYHATCPQWPEAKE